MTNSVEKVITLMGKGATISEALEETYTPCRVKIPFDDAKFNIALSELPLSTKAINSLMRTKITTLIEFINYVNERKWRNIQGFGVTLAKEVYKEIIEVAWKKMNIEEKAEFLLLTDLINKTK